VTLFGREIAVTIGSLRITGLRMQLKVMKSLAREPNTLDLAITNLSAQSRAAAQEKDVLVTVAAGYQGTSRVLFVGNARKVSHRRVGTDWETGIQCGDGEVAQRDARVNVSLAPGATLAQAVGQVADAMALPLGNAVDKLKAGDFGGAFGAFAHGVALHGPAATQMDRLLASAGYTWSVQDGALQMLRVDEATADDAVVLRGDDERGGSTGLIGSPELGENGVVKARSLLQADLRPGRRVKLEAESVEGLYRVEKVTHAGDTAGSDWYSDLELKRL
jgi:hypothetical protein